MLATSSASPSTASPLPGDSLLACVAWLCEHHQLAASPSALVAGLPVAEGFTPACALTALREAGMVAGLLPRPLARLPEALVPVIVLLKEQGAGILLGRSLGEGSAADACRYLLILPALGGEPVAFGHEELQALYAGHIIAARPQAKAEQPVAAQPSLPRGHWLASTLWRYRQLYASAAWGALLINVLALASIFFTMNVYDRVVPNQAYVTLWSLVVGVGLAMVFEALARLARAHLLDSAGRRADLVMGTLLFRQALAIRMEHKPRSAGAFANQLREFESVRDFATSASLTAVSDLPFVLLFIGVIFVVGGPLGWVPLAVALAILLISLAVQWPLARVLRESLQQAALKQGVLIESIDGLETLKATAGEGFMQQRWEAASAAAAQTAMRVRQISTLTTTTVAFLQQLQTVIIITWGVYLIGDAALSLGALIASVMLCSRATAPLGQIAGLAVRLQQARAALQSLDALMALPTDRNPQSGYLSQPVVGAEVVLKSIDFAYPALPLQPQPMLLHGVDLRIRPGERVAVLGAVGSGKSTLLKVLARLYQPTAGQMFCDGLAVTQIDPADWRSHVGFVAQEARLFCGTLKENLLLGRPGASTAELLQVLRMTGLDKMAARHPLGVQLPLGEGGSGLSGGQRQLVALARTLLARPGLLLLDEPTSAMDSQTEAQFLRHLQEAVEGRTLVVVTHRPAVLVLVERLVVIEEGKVVADGPKAKVLAWLAARTQAGASQ